MKIERIYSITGLVKDMVSMVKDGKQYLVTEGLLFYLHVVSGIELDSQVKHQVC